MAFRGTQMTSLADLYTDADVGGMFESTHRGFQRYYEQILPMVVDKIRPLMDMDAYPRKLLVTGHSMGGAIGEIFSMNSSNTLSRPVDACYTFNTPAWGSASQMSNLYDSVHACWRVAHDRDFVSHVLRVRFQSSIRCMIVQSDGDISQEQSSLFSTSNYVMTFLRNMFRGRESIAVMIRNHSITTMQEALDNVPSEPFNIFTKRSLLYDWNSFLS